MTSADGVTLMRDTDHPDFDASAIGGRNMRNQRTTLPFPSIRWMKENVYFAEADYGRNWLDRLGIRVTGIEIPAQYAGIVTRVSDTVCQT